MPGVTGGAFVCRGVKVAGPEGKRRIISGFPIRSKGSWEILSSLVPVLGSFPECRKSIKDFPEWNELLGPPAQSWISFTVPSSGHHCNRGCGDQSPGVTGAKCPKLKS